MGAVFASAQTVQFQLDTNTNCVSVNVNVSSSLFCINENVNMNTKRKLLLYSNAQLSEMLFYFFSEFINLNLLLS